MIPSSVTSGQRLVGRLAVIGVTPEDDEQERLDKAVTPLSTCLITALSTVWVVTYFSLGLT